VADLESSSEEGNSGKAREDTGDERVLYLGQGATANKQTPAAAATGGGSWRGLKQQSGASVGRSWQQRN
jgi:hypothetical protein